jgi:hypothetical protein
VVDELLPDRIDDGSFALEVLVLGIVDAIPAVKAVNLFID